MGLITCQHLYRGGCLVRDASQREYYKVVIIDFMRCKDNNEIDRDWKLE